jgi:ABC-type Zn uptake system ZnuABC Zn-binding protein ZnuA
MGKEPRTKNQEPGPSTLMAVLCSWFLVLLLSACGQPAATTPPLNVVATIAPLADWARQVGQDRVSVRQLVPTGVDPRSYVLTEADRRVLAEADVVLANGAELEPWLTPALMTLTSDETIVLDLAQFLARGQPAREVVVRDPFQSQPDEQPRNAPTERVYVPARIASPYLWLDPGPSMAQRAVTLIADTFTRADPDHLLHFRRNAERYNGELENLDGWVARRVRTWPRTRIGQNNVVLMQMPDRSWQTFSDGFGITLRTTAEITAVSSRLPSNIPLFVDTFTDRQAQLEAFGLRQPSGELHPLGSDSYVEMMRENVDIMTRGMRSAVATSPGSGLFDVTP